MNLGKVSQIVKNTKIQTLAIFCLSLIFFSILQFSFSNLLGPDGYYHTKMAVLMSQGNIVFKKFPWLYFTVLRDNFVDQHFLFHLTLVPFIFIKNPIFGAKIATVFFATIFCLIFFIILKKNKIKFSFWWTLLLLVSSSGFIFRMSLAKASALSLSFLFLGFLALIKKRYFLLFVLSFFYVWFYGGFVLILVLSGCYFLAGILENFRKNKNPLLSLPLQKGKNLFDKLSPSLISLFSSLFGVIFGFLPHPYSKNLINFLKIQIFQTGPFAQISVGQEWYPYENFNLVLGSSLVFVCFISAIFLLVLKRIVQKQFINQKSLYFKEIITLLFMAVFFYLLTLRSQRFIEYWTPFTVLFCAFVVNEEIININFKKYFQKKLFLKVIIVSAMGTLIFLLASFTVFRSWQSINRGYQSYKSASQWLSKNTAKNSIIFNCDWSDFPPLFFYNDNNYYIAGLDPAFMYAYNQTLYKKYSDLFKIDNSYLIYSTVKNVFDSDYLIINEKFQKTEKVIKNDKNFKKVYSDDYLRIYWLK